MHPVQTTSFSPMPPPARDHPLLKGPPVLVGTTAGNLCRFDDAPEGAEAREGAFNTSGLDRLAMPLPKEGRPADGKHGTEPGRLLAEPKVIWRTTKELDHLLLVIEVVHDWQAMEMNC